ncbi:MAG TPA: hypothetical protein PK299_04055 [Anaerolineales bacterium]|nr:hypothetical protein [Anaerolineales bacterium]
MNLPESVIEEVTRRVYREYPAVAGCSPKIRTHDRGNGVSSYTLSYRGFVEVEGGIKMPVSVNVSLDTFGKVVKITSSK